MFLKLELFVWFSVLVLIFDYFSYKFHCSARFAGIVEGKIIGNLLKSSSEVLVFDDGRNCSRGGCGGTGSRTV